MQVDNSKKSSKLLLVSFIRNDTSLVTFPVRPIFTSVVFIEPQTCVTDLCCIYVWFPYHGKVQFPWDSSDPVSLCSPDWVCDPALDQTLWLIKTPEVYDNHRGRSASVCHNFRCYVGHVTIVRWQFMRVTVRLLCRTNLSSACHSILPNVQLCMLFGVRAGFGDDMPHDVWTEMVLRRHG